MSLLGRIRSLYLAIGLAVLTLISFGACGLTRLLFGHRVAKRVHELILGQGTYYWMRVTGAWHLTVKGRVPDTKETFVIVANHASFADHAMMSFIPIWKKYLTKSKYFTLPFFGWTQWIVEDIGVDVTSKESRAKSMVHLAEIVKQGNSVVVYPEGTRVGSPSTLGSFKEGAFKTAKECKVRILPVCLHNTNDAIGLGFKVGRANLVISIGEPFEVEEVAEAVEKARVWIQSELTKGSAPAVKSKEQK